MNVQQSRIRAFRSGMVPTSALGILACVVVGAGLYASAYTGLNSLGGTPVDTSERVATDTIAPEAPAPETGLLVAAPAKPSRPPAPETIVDVADEFPGSPKLDLPKRVVVPPAKPLQDATKATTADVARFDDCLPECETRDPAIAERSAGAWSPAILYPPSEPSDELKETGAGFSPVREAAYVLIQTAATPRKTLRTARQALNDMMRLDW